MTLQKTITALWLTRPIPGPIIELPADLEGQAIARWLTGKTFEVVAQDDKLHSQLPFLFLNDQAASYYLGSYALRTARQLDHGIREFYCDFALSHLADFLASETSEAYLQLLPQPFLDRLIALANTLFETDLISKPKDSSD